MMFDGNDIESSQLGRLKEKIREITKKFCHTPLLIGGAFVAINEDARGPEMRPSLATPEEMLGAIDSAMGTLTSANNYLRESPTSPLAVAKAMTDRVTAMLALPSNASAEDIVLCVKLAVKRLAELELKVATADTSASMADNPSTNENLDKRVGSLEERVRSLEAATIAMAQEQARKELSRG